MTERGDQGRPAADGLDEGSPGAGAAGSTGAPRSASAPRARLGIVVHGIVQGVGFRPFVHRLATRLGLDGFVQNAAHGVTIEVEGAAPATRDFVDALSHEAPPLARIHGLEVCALSARGERGFRIESSSEGRSSEQTLVPPDVATCAACLAELRDPQDRRYRYPFLNCTDCGPRYTIIRGVPYDRPLTTMQGFSLCPRCRAEYEEITDRRYHAQPVACPTCGPRLWLVDGRGEGVAGDAREGHAAGDPLAETIARLRAGQIGAIKGLGGFHLACDATDSAAVARLRQRKGRPHKPFAVMARDAAEVGRFARLTGEARALLETWRRPIVLLPARDPSPLAPEVSGTSPDVGTMLPYTPLHHLLLEGPFVALVMTSGNRTDEPIVKDNDEARARLGEIADFFLLHDRPIQVPVDDSVLRATARGALLVRRARGYVPDPIRLPAAGPSVLATGADLKNACALTRGPWAILSQHIGDLEHVEAADLLRATLRHLEDLLGVAPGLVVHDLHPDYQSTRLAEELGIDRLALQHHHAHALSCLADNGRTGPALALTLDGTGYGTDGTVWGGELLAVDGLRCERLAHLEPLALPGGDRATLEPWRMAVSALVETYGPAALDTERPLFHAAEPAFVRAVAELCLRPGAALRTSSTGRLFDAVASLLDLCQRVSYEGQAAVELEGLAARARGPVDGYPFELVEAQGPIRVRTTPFIRRVVDDLRRGEDPASIALAFHEGLAAALVEAAARGAARTGLRTVALSGGTLQNRILHASLAAGLEARGLEPLVHHQVPPNDGGIALGQAWAGLLHHTR